MEINISESENASVFSIIGSIDSLTANQFTNVCVRYIDSEKNKIVADFSEVSYISSAGLRSLIILAKETRKNGGDFRLAGLRPEILKIVTISGFSSILKIFPDTSSAVASFK